MVDSADILNAGILIVDDQEVNVLLLERMLRGAGYVSITSTMDPNEVCELHRKNRYGLILLDLLMPGMDGFKVMEGLKEIEEGSYLPVLVITAQPDQKLRALRAGAKDFVSKPFDLAEVLARVHNMLEVRLLYAELQKALENVELLSGLLPICMWCKKIRDDKGYWNAIEHYIGHHSEAEFAHGICPDCKRKYSGEMFREEK
ncbi:MAG: Cyclic di-GMP phosphodiesterase response regulator RpfG [Bacteroidetes bacterium]|nr:Cyclic di-GMP phosphodiesterase response regulator RpfG [Bacteroidota bacterium]